MEQTKLLATRRTTAKRAAKRLRQKGLVPCMVYGYGVENIPLQIESLVLSRTLVQAGSSQLIQLQIDDEPSTQPVLAREIQRDVLTGEPLHVDFLAVSMTEKITAELSITLTGEPEPVARGEGMLLHGINTLEIECLPGDLIPSLEVDVSGLDFDNALYVGDLDLPAGIVALSDPQEMVAQLVYESRAEGEEEEEIFEERAEVEVITRSKADEGEE